MSPPTTMSSWNAPLPQLSVLLATLVMAASARTLVWSDEFDGPAGSALDPAKWKYEIGGGDNGWGNRELEYYTDSRVNSACNGRGQLEITATTVGADGKSCWYGSCTYTSARLVTDGLFSTKFGRIEARIRAPFGKGIWPAFWTLGTDIGSIGWPACGEMDIMEIRGSDPSRNSGTLHGPGYSGGGGVTGSYWTPDGRWLSDDFHVYAVDWSRGRVSWSVDDFVYQTRTPADLPPNTAWVFDRDFFLILNLAVGGNFDGNPDGSTQIPQSMSVDYVRVYSE